MPLHLGSLNRPGQRPWGCGVRASCRRSTRSVWRGPRHCLRHSSERCLRWVLRIWGAGTGASGVVTFFGSGSGWGWGWWWWWWFSRPLLSLYTWIGCVVVVVSPPTHTAGPERSQHSGGAGAVVRGARGSGCPGSRAHGGHHKMTSL